MSDLNEINARYMDTIASQAARIAELERQLAETNNIAPIARISVNDIGRAIVDVYSPGLPPGDHEVFPVPVKNDGQLRPLFDATRTISESDDKKMRDVFDAAIEWYRMKNNTSGTMVMMLDRVDKLDKAIEACERART